MSLAVGASQKNSRAEFALVRSNPAFARTPKIFRLFPPLMSSVWAQKSNRSLTPCCDLPSPK
jgi:hypothetical protein